MSNDKFIVTKEDSNFAIIPNEICQKLSDAEALGLYVYLTSLPPKWEFYKNVIRKHFAWGRDKLEKKISVLRCHNLVEVLPSRNEKGQFTDWNLHVKNGRNFTIPQNTEIPNPENQNTENQYTGELSTGLIKNCTQNTENPVTGEPVTGFSTPIKYIDTKTISETFKSFCEPPVDNSDPSTKPSLESTNALSRPKNDNGVDAEPNTDSDHYQNHGAKNGVINLSAKNIDKPASVKKTRAEYQKENAKRHDFADKLDNKAKSKEQMNREAKFEAENKEFKRTSGMPDYLKKLNDKIKRSTTRY